MTRKRRERLKRLDEMVIANIAEAARPKRDEYVKPSEEYEGGVMKVVWEGHQHSVPNGILQSAVLEGHGKRFIAMAVRESTGELREFQVKGGWSAGCLGLYTAKAEAARWTAGEAQYLRWKP